MFDYTTSPAPRRMRRLLLAGALLLLLSGGGCAYKIEIQQGNERLLNHVDELRVGMSRDEVVRLLGPPPAPRLFKKNVWIYVYQLRDAGFVGRTRLRSVELVFDDAGALSEINLLRDDYAEEAGEDEAAPEAQEGEEEQGDEDAEEEAGDDS